MMEEDERIQAVINTAAHSHEYSILLAWEAHLHKHLKLPCKARYLEDESNLVGEGAEVIIRKIEDEVDEQYGVLCAIKGFRGNIFPLCDMEPLEINKDTQALMDYVVWFANR